MPASDLDYGEIRAACEKATAGPWCECGGSVLTDDDGGAPTKAWICHTGRRDDAELIARSRTWLPALLARVEAAEAEVTKIKNERDEARAFGEDAAKRYNDLIARGPVLTCAFCSWEYPAGTPATGHAALTEHVSECEKHPMRAVENERDVMRGLLVESSSSLGYALSCLVDGHPTQRRIESTLMKIRAALPHPAASGEEKRDG